ncbi:hypothetical protein R6Q59_025857 [Mikania micrantha]
MEEMASSWIHQERNDELKLKIHYTSLELEAVKAKASEEMNRNTESIKQLLHLLKLVCHERDEARNQIQKLLNKIMPSVNKSMIIQDCFVIDQVHQHHHQYPLMKHAKANSSIAESNSLSDAYINHFSSSVTYPEFSNNTTVVQDYSMFLSGFRSTHSLQEMNHATLMMDSMIKGKALPQKGNLLKTVIEAGPLLQTLIASNPLPNSGNLSQVRLFSNHGQNQTKMMTKQSQKLSEMSYGSFSQMIDGDGGILSFNDTNSSNFQGWMMATNCPTASNFVPVEKRQRIR